MTKAVALVSYWLLVAGSLGFAFVARLFCLAGLPFATPFCHFEPFAKRRKIHILKSAICTLNLWILRYAQYDKQAVPFGLPYWLLVARLAVPCLPCLVCLANCSAFWAGFLGLLGWLGSLFEQTLPCSPTRCHFERSEKSILWFCGYFATLSMTRILSFWAFCKKAKNPRFKVQFAL